MDNLICIDGTTLTRKFYDRQVVLTFSDIDTYHKRVDGTAKQNFIRNRKYFTEKVDYFVIKRKELGDKMTAVYGFNQKAPSGTLLTKSGYLMIVKSMNDPVAWEQHRKLVNTYFLAEQLVAEKQQENNTAVALTTQTENFPAETRDMFLDFLKTQQELMIAESKRNEEFRDIMMKSFQTLAGVIAKQVEMIGTMNASHVNLENHQQEPKQSQDSKKENSGEKSEYQKYCELINEPLQEIVRINPFYDNRNAVLSTAYRSLRNEYGICYEQYQKEYFSEMQRKPRNMLDLFCWMEKKNPAMKNILRSRLETMLENSKKLEYVDTEKKINTDQVMFPPVSLEELEVLINYIWAFYGKGGTNAPIWHKFFNSLDKDYKIDWEGRRSIYKKAKGIKSSRRISKIEILRENDDLAKCAYDYATINLDKLFPEAIEYLNQSEKK